MTVATTGSTVLGLNQGLVPNAVSTGSAHTIRYVESDPDGIVTSPDASGLALSWETNEVYIAKVAGGSTWYKLGSTT